MRAGLLKETAVFFGESTTQSASGFVSKSEAILATVRCYRKKRTDTSAMSGKEEFNAGVVTIQVRNNPAILNAKKFKYEENSYRIEQNLLQIEDNTRLVTGTKINA